jgi:hypothetical protein
MRIDLDALHRRLSQWLAQPIRQLSGTADCEMQWAQSDDSRLRTVLRLNTTPLRIESNSGSMNEPAWNGSLDVVGRVFQNQFQQIDRAALQLTSENEALQVDVLEPVVLAATVPNGQPLPPATTKITIRGDMAAWQQRARMLAGVDVGMAIAGIMTADLQGHADLKHIEVAKANWTMDQVALRGQGFAMQEPRMVGVFAGRIDSQDLSRLQVDTLTVQAESFAIAARDAAAANGRQGQAAFRVDPRRLLNSMASETSASPSTTTLDAEVTGTATWTLDANTLAWKAVVDGKDIRVVSIPQTNVGNLVSSSNSSGESLLWQEPQAQLAMIGRYDMKTGFIHLPETTIATDWLSYAGQASMESKADEASEILAQGQLTYDAGTVARRLKSYTGDHVNIVGKRTEPFKLKLVSAANQSLASSLQLETKLGWDQANVAGIDLGNTDVPIIIRDGKLRSATEIPVNQGALRWNVETDVAGDPIVIRQAPDKVLDNVNITPLMCRGWLKYVAPLMADVTKVEGRLSLQVNEAAFVPTNLKQQTIAGQLQMHGATVGPGPLADQILSLVQQIKALKKAAAPTAALPSQTWLQLPEQKIDFAVDQGRVLHRNLQIAAGDVTIYTTGEVNIDGSLQMQLQVPIRSEWIDGTPALAGLAGQSIALPVSGTIQKPQVDFRSLGQLTMQLAQSAAMNAGQNLIQKQLDRGLNKVLGPMQQQLQNFQGVFPQGLLPPTNPATPPPTPAIPAVPGAG